MVGAIPDVYGWTRRQGVARDLFRDGARRAGAAHDDACAHGHRTASGRSPALEMTKWFDTNYHYMVPEFTRGQTFKLASLKPVDEFREAKALGYQTRPVLLGPVTYPQARQEQGCRARSAVAARRRCCRSISTCCAGSPRTAPIGCRSTSPAWCSISTTRRREALARRLYGASPSALPTLKIMLTTYFGGLGDNLDTALSLPVAGLHLDLVRAPDQLDAVAGKAPHGPGAVARRHRRPQYLARRSAGAARSAGARGRQARHRSCPDRAVLLAAACADRSRRWRPISIRS